MITLFPELLHSGVHPSQYHPLHALAASSHITSTGFSTNYGYPKGQGYAHYDKRNKQKQTNKTQSQVLWLQALEQKYGLHLRRNEPRRKLNTSVLRLTESKTVYMLGWLCQLVIMDTEFTFDGTMECGIHLPCIKSWLLLKSRRNLHKLTYLFVPQT